MKHEHPADRPMAKPCPIVCRTSDLEFDFGTPVLTAPEVPRERWRSAQMEQEHGLRADVYRSLGLM